MIFQGLPGVLLDCQEGILARCRRVIGNACVAPFLDEIKRGIRALQLLGCNGKKSSQKCGSYFLPLSVILSTCRERVGLMCTLKGDIFDSDSLRSNSGTVWLKKKHAGSSLAKLNSIIISGGASKGGRLMR
jgi:hypothetical protein